MEEVPILVELAALEVQVEVMEVLVLVQQQEETQLLIQVAEEVEEEEMWQVMNIMVEVVDLVLL